MEKHSPNRRLPLLVSVEIENMGNFIGAIVTLIIGVLIATSCLRNGVTGIRSLQNPASLAGANAGQNTITYLKAIAQYNSSTGVAIAPAVAAAGQMTLTDPAKTLLPAPTPFPNVQGKLQAAGYSTVQPIAAEQNVTPAIVSGNPSAATGSATIGIQVPVANGATATIQATIGQGIGGN